MASAFSRFSLVGYIDNKKGNYDSAILIYETGIGVGREIGRVGEVKDSQFGFGH